MDSASTATQTDVLWAEPELTDDNWAEIGRRAFNAARWIDSQQSTRTNEVLFQGRLYGGVRPEAYASQAFPANTLFWSKEFTAPRGPPKISMNVVRACIDTAVARVTNMEVRPLYLTEGGDWAIQQKAKKLELYSDGQLAAAQARTLGPEVFRDAGWADLGAIHVTTLDGQPYSERVFPLELKVDHADGRYRKPRQVFRTKWVSRDALVDRYPDFEDEINAAGTANWEDSADSQMQTLAQQVFVVEGWFLPRGKKPGRHVVAVDGQALFVEPWTRKSFPFAIVRYSNRLRGFYGIGMAEHLKGNQSELNHICKTLQEIYQKATVPQVWLEAGNRVQKGQLNNEIMTAHTYVGKPPIFHDGIGPHPTLLERADKLWQQCFVQEGLNPEDGTAMRPQGLNSAPAQRVYRDGGTERFSVATKQYEQFRLDWSECLIEEARDIYKKNKKISVLVPGKRFAQRLNFSEVDLDRDKYILQAFPTSSLPRDPAGRLGMIQDMMEAGLVDAQTGKRLLNYPDVSSELDLELAPYEDILGCISDVLEGKAYKPPEPFQLLDWGIKAFQWSYLKARRDGAPQDVLEDLMLWVVQANDLLKFQQPGGSAPGAGPPPPAGAGGPPLASPAAAPTSNLLPTAPAAAAANLQ